MAIRPGREEYLARQYVVEKQCTAAQCLETVMAGLDDMLCQFEGALQGPAARRGELAARCLAVFSALERMSVVSEQDDRRELHELDKQLAALYEQCSLLLLRSQAEQCAESLRSVRKIVGLLRDTWHEAGVMHRPSGQVRPPDVEGTAGTEKVTARSGTEWTA